MLQVRLLGPVAALAAHGPVPLGGNKPRALLATLVLEHGRVVPTSRLIDILWPESPPRSARALVQTYVSTLRRSLADHGCPDVIDTQPPGYVARPDRIVLDVDVFTDLVGEAEERAREGDHGAAVDLLSQAIELHGGSALAGLDESALAAESRRLDQLLVAAQAERFEACLRIGRLDHLVELTGVVARHPADERLRAQLMTTLYRLGRQADALACYQEARTALLDELGVEPGPALQHLHGAILRGGLPTEAPGGAGGGAPDHPPLPGRAPGDDPPVGAPGHEPGSGPGHEVGSGRGGPPGAPGLAGLVPAQAPAPPTDFTGREAVRHRLVATVRAGTPAVHVITGLAGSGKSALAAWLAHDTAQDFPDGQLYVDLRATTGIPTTTDEALAGFLGALDGTPGAGRSRLPDSTHARATRYRSLVAHRRILVLLDDAADEQQVRPLLPAGSGCLAVVTARGALPGLAGVTRTELPPLTDDEACELLERIVGVERTYSDVEAARRIVAACDNLPLAIRVAGARLATRGRLPMAVMADRLADERRRLDELAVGDLAVRSSLAASYHALPAPARAALRALGFHGAPEFDPWALGWLLDVPTSTAEQLAEQLVDTHLVELAGVGPAGVPRYRMRGLVRIFARERAEAEDPPQTLYAAVSRTAGRGVRALPQRPLEPAADTAMVPLKRL